MMTKLPEGVLQELKTLSRDELQDILDFNRALRGATGFRSALDPAIASLLSEREVPRRVQPWDFPVRSVSRLTSIPQS
jgi:hypothetical protein